MLGEHNLSSSSTLSKVNCLVIRTLYFVSVLGDLQEGHVYGKRLRGYTFQCHFPSARAQKRHFCAWKGRLARQGYHYAIMNDYLAPENDYLALVKGYPPPGNVIPCARERYPVSTGTLFHAHRNVTTLSACRVE